MLFVCQWTEPLCITFILLVCGVTVDVVISAPHLSVDELQHMQGVIQQNMAGGMATTQRWSRGSLTSVDDSRSFNDAMGWIGQQKVSSLAPTPRAQSDGHAHIRTRTHKHIHRLAGSGC